MVTVTFEEAICRKRNDAHEKYRLILLAEGRRGGELKSVYRRGETSFAWDLPFKDPVTFSNSHSPLRVSIELRKKGWLGMSGQTVCSYVLEVDRDCQSRVYDLVAESDIGSAPRLSLTVTVAGLAAKDTEPVSQSHQDPIGALPPVDSRTAEQGLSASLQNSSIVEPPPHPASIESPTAYPPSSAHSATVPAFQVIAPDDVEHKTSPSLDGLEKSTRDQSSGLSRTAPRPTASHVNSSQLLSAESAARKAKDEQSSIRQRSNSITDSISTVEPVASAAGGLGDAMYTGVSRLEAVVRVINVAADIHPLVKGVWSLLNTAYTLAKQERDLDLKIEDLVHALDANCDFAKELAANDLTEIAASIVGKILGEVQNGARLIEEYCTVRKSRASMFRFATSTTSIRVDACLQTLEAFQRHLSRYIVAGVQHDLQSLSSKLSGEMELLNAKIDQMNQDARIKELLAEMPFAPEADRAMRSDDRGCLPGTRGEIIDALVQWATGKGVDASQSYIRGLDPNSRVVWLCGVAGSGKSSIAISFAKSLRSQQRLGAIYGFETAFQKSLNPTNLFSTIVRQRAEQQRTQKEQLLHTLELLNHDQRATLSPAEQFSAFMTAPVTGDGNVCEDVVVIDAFDESGSTSMRRAALHLLSPEPSNSTFPQGVRFVVTSRYDPDIARRLESVSSGNQSIASVLRMEDIYPPHTERDIELYVVHMLRDTDGLDAARAAGDLVRLAMTAEHSFQWASVACRYIADADDHDGAHLPSERLNETLATRGGLDDMYLSILNRSFGDRVSKESGGTRSLAMILGCLVCAEEPVSVHIIAALASANPSTHTVDEPNFHLLARKLSSIITGTKNTTTPLVAFHTSFTDFLANEPRSHRYAVNPAAVHLHLALASLATMKKLLRFNICHFPTSFLRNDEVLDLADRVKENISSELSYACRFWPAHVAAALAPASAETGLLRTSLSEFLKDKLLLLQWLEVMSLTGTHAYESLSPLALEQTDSNNLSDLLLFITNFSIPISLSVPHIYLSALAFAPSLSTITPTVTHFPNLVRPDRPLLSWPRVRHKLEHSSQVQSIAWSPDGRWLVFGEGDQSNVSDNVGGGISVWDVYLGRLMLPRVATTSAVLSVAVFRDGNLLASGHKDGTVQLWDARTLAAKGSPLKGHSDFVRSVAFSPTDSLLASGSDDSTVALWDLVTGSMVGNRLEGHWGWVHSVAFSPDGALLLSGSDDKTIRLWDVHTHSAMGDPLKGHTEYVRCGSFSPEGSLLASGSKDKTVRLWDARSGTAIGEPLAGHNGAVWSVAFSADGQTLASCSGDKTVRLWDVESRSPSSEPLTGHTDAVRSIAFSPDGALLASGSSDKTVHIWDARALASKQESPGTQFKIQNFATFSRDGELLASGSVGHAIQLWDVHSMSVVGEPLSGHTDDIKCVAFAPNGTLLASGSDDKTVRLWDVRTGSAVGEPLEGHQDWVRAVAFSPDGKLLASGSDDSTIRLWDTHARSASGEPLTGHFQFVMSVAFSPDGSTLASGDAGGTVRLWDVRTRSPIGEALKGHSRPLRCIAFSHDRKLLASGSEDQTVRIWDVTTHSAVGEPLRGHTGYVAALVFSPDGTLLVSCSEYDSTAWAWDVREPSDVGEPVALLRHETNVFSIAFLSDSPLLSSITRGGVVRKWDLRYLLSTRTPKVYSPEGHPQNHSSMLLPDHPDLSSLPPDFLEVLDDGWVVGPKQELVLWIPPAVRPPLSNLLEIERFGGSPPTFLDFANFVCGSDWTKCYSPPSVPTSNS